MIDLKISENFISQKLIDKQYLKIRQKKFVRFNDIKQKFII